MAKPLFPDDPWALVEPVPPPRKPRRLRCPGRKPVDDRVALAGIIFVLKTGIPWEAFPAEMGCCGMTPWNRPRDWQAAGVWPKAHEILLAELRGADLIDFSRVVVDSASVRAVSGGPRPGRAPRTAARRAASTTRRSTPAASRSRRS